MLSFCKIENLGNSLTASTFASVFAVLKSCHTVIYTHTRWHGVGVLEKGGLEFQKYAQSKSIVKRFHYCVTQSNQCRITFDSNCPVLESGLQQSMCLAGKAMFFAFRIRIPHSIATNDQNHVVKMLKWTRWSACWGFVRCSGRWNVRWIALQRVSLATSFCFENFEVKTSLRRFFAAITKAWMFNLEKPVSFNVFVQIDWIDV